MLGHAVAICQLDIYMKIRLHKLCTWCTRPVFDGGLTAYIDSMSADSTLMWLWLLWLLSANSETNPCPRSCPLSPYATGHSDIVVCGWLARISSRSCDFRKFTAKSSQNFWDYTAQSASQHFFSHDHIRDFDIEMKLNFELRLLKSHDTSHVTSQITSRITNLLNSHISNHFKRHKIFKMTSTNRVAKYSNLAKITWSQITFERSCHRAIFRSFTNVYRACISPHSLTIMDHDCHLIRPRTAPFITQSRLPINTPSSNAMEGG